MRAAELVVIIFSVVAGILAIMVIYSVAFNGSTNSALLNWGGTIIGFFFGAFISLLKDALSSKSE